LLAYVAALVHQARVTGLTVDEPSHLVSAHLYWQGRDVLKPRDMPPAIKIAGGWVAGLLHLPPPDADPLAWQSQHEWVVASAWLGRLTPAQVQDLVFFSRLPLLLFPLATAALLWWWARQLFTPMVGLLCAVLFACEPTALGHGALFKNDHAATFGLLLAAYRAWTFWRTPTLAQSFWLALAVALAALAKLSMLVWIPLALVLVIVRSRAAGPPLLLLATVYVVLVAACQFHVDRATWMMPQLYVDGVEAIADSNATPNAIWFWGERRAGGDWRYFLGALAVKAPLLLLACLLAALPRLRQPFLIVPGLLYFVLASASSMQFGFRLILPCLPFAILACGYAPALFRAAALGGTVFAAAACYPYGLSYFNALAGPPQNALHYLADSNIDWGQGLPALGQFTRDAQVQWITTYYFGNDHPRRFLVPGKFNVAPPPWEAAYAQGEFLEPAPGLYAISANMLTGQFFAPQYRRYFRRFRQMQPYAVVNGGSIFIYLVDMPK